jgi:hypothetical protein
MREPASCATSRSGRLFILSIMAFPRGSNRVCPGRSDLRALSSFLPSTIRMLPSSPFRTSETSSPDIFLFMLRNNPGRLHSQVVLVDGSGGPVHFLPVRRAV